MSGAPSGTREPGGSKWHRWDPHIHAPGTVFNNQYRGREAWEKFLSAIESSTPPIRALGITDYYNVDVYEQVLLHRKAGRLAEVDLIFPNVELRYGIGTGSGSPINFHLMVSPDDPEHVEQIRRFFRSLTYTAYGQPFRCERSDLIRLGQTHDKSIADDVAAFACGANQFKVNPDELRAEWKKNPWVQENVLIAVAAGSNDGTSGLQGDPSLATLRKEIERTAHIIFSSQSKQRAFWLGQGAVAVEKLASDWNGRKPCLHGSDAHGPDRVGVVEKGRYCWIKGDLAFESLRQTCLEPETRVFIGAMPPRGALPSQVVTNVEVTDAAWLVTNNVPLNAGLVGIIGARGSGKTALADIIAAGGYKPQAAAMQTVLQKQGWHHTEAIYVGNTDDDMKTARNGKILFLNAKWHAEASPYGYEFDSPIDVARFIDCFCLNATDWFWAIEKPPLRVYAVAPFSTLSRNYLHAQQYSAHARETAKHYGGDATFWGRLLASRVYFSGLVDEIDYITHYPGHSPQSKQPVVSEALTILADSLQRRYIPDLLCRHTQAQKSQNARNSGQTVDALNQLNTINVQQHPIKDKKGERYKSSPLGRSKSVLVVDDICTQGNSFEAARAFIGGTGAQAICLAWLKTINTDYRSLADSPKVQNPYIHAAFQKLPRVVEHSFHAAIRNSAATLKLDDIFQSYYQWDWPG
jgi:hypothetical protein